MPSSKKNSKTRERALLAQAKKDFAERKLRGEKEAQLAAALRRITVLESEKDAAKQWSAQRRQRIDLNIDLSKTAGNSSATVFSMASDWHVEVEVLRESVQGLNEFNLEIAKKRAESFFAGVLTMTEMLGAYSTIDAVVVPVLGDMIDNHLHHDSPEKTLLMPVQAAGFARDLLSAGLTLLRKEIPRKIPIRVVCHTGNHGRSTKKVHIGTEHGHSWETMFYADLQREFDAKNNMQVAVPPSDVSYHRVYDKTVRMMHGHAINYQGGIGGIYVPINRYLAQQDQTMPADLTLMGHFHQISDLGRAFVNGSLVGYSTYGQHKGFRYEPPAQQFFSLIRRQGKTLRGPQTRIWL